MADNQQAAEEIVEAVQEALNNLGVDASFTKKDAEYVIAAARPLIEAETREKAAKVAESAGDDWSFFNEVTTPEAAYCEACSNIAQSIRSMGGAG